MKPLEGKDIADAMLDRVKDRISALRRMPGFGAVLVGDDPASAMYVDLKKKAAHKCGMLFCDYTLPENASEDQVLQIIEFLNNDPEIDGILVQLPLPRHLDKAKILNAINPKKDVDGLTDANHTCSNEKKKCFVSPFSRAIVTMLEHANQPIAGKCAVVLCNSHIFGEVICALLTEKGVKGSIVLAQEKERYLEDMQHADILISAVGKKNFVTSDMVKDRAIIIDGGIEKVDSEVSGDVDASSFAKRDVILTPVPGGVGPVTVACLMENVFMATKRRE